MRNYVIINGVSSLTIEGLAINILPAITKPLMRNEIEEIDGRDGDIITELGYSAYDKEMEIGLWGNYDIDEIIKFFTGEGTIIFSTEPDKYYNFKILNQIDYDKLLKFRTATVTFHCQPFKYPTDEEPIEVEPVVKTGEGETITIDDTYEGNLEMLLKGNTYQEGTPTPESPQEVHTVSGDNEVEVRGKNFFNKDDITLNKSISSTGEPVNSTGSVLSGFITINENTTYYLSHARGSNYVRTIGYYDKNKVFISAQSISGGENVSGSFTTPSNTRYVRVVSGIDYYTTCQLEKGSSATSYEPYAGATYPINLPEGMFLGSIGDYKDTFFKAEEGNPIYDSLDSATKQTLDSNEWYLEKKIGKVVLDNTYTPSTSSGVAYSGFSDRAKTTSEVQVIYCDKLSFGGNYTSVQNAVSNMPTNSIGLNNNGTSLNVFLKVSGVSTSGEYTTWATNNTPVIYYQLATPTYTKIEGTLASQLEEVYRAKSEEGQTNISQTNNDLPFWIEATITFTPPSTINNIGNIYAKPILTITGSGNVGVVLNGIEILQINLGEGNTIAIDVPNLEAYNPSDNTLMNRLVTGDYMKLLIQEGENTLSFNGDVSSYSVTNYTRWI